MTERRSRMAWDDMDKTEPHQEPLRMPRAAVVAFIAMGVSLVVLGAAVAYLLVYILGRGHYRDEQDAKINERIDVAVCAVLDNLPAGPVLDPTRKEYGCENPGLPPQELTPEQRKNLSDFFGGAPTASTDAPGNQMWDPNMPKEIP